MVGTSTATCLPLDAATNAARNATSVLPKPTSPHTNLSIGRGERKSAMVDKMALAWSAVSSKAKPAQNLAYSCSSNLKAIM